MRLPAHKCTAYYANDRANNSPRKRSARMGRAFCAHFVYICTQQLIVHIRTWYIGSECSHSIDLSCHVYRSVLCGYRGVYRRYYFVCRRWKKTFHRTRLAPFFSALLSPRFLRSLFPLSLSLSLSSSLSFSLCLSLLSARHDVRAREGKTESGRSPPMHSADSNFYQRRNFAHRLSAIPGEGHFGPPPSSLSVDPTFLYFRGSWK